MKSTSIILDANQTRLSHIMQLKQLFAQHPGQQPIQINFQSSSKSLAVLHIEGKGGIELTEELRKKIREIKPVLTID